MRAFFFRRQIALSENVFLTINSKMSIIERSQIYRSNGWSPPLVHLLVSIAIISCVAILIFSFWFPVPFRELAGGSRLFWIIVGVDMVCGPILTWLLFRPSKTRLALTVDIGLVIAIQVAALIYGLYTLSQARPLALVFEVDRFRVVSYSDLAEDELHLLPDWAHPWRFSEIRTVGLRLAVTLDEKLDSVNASLQGVEPSQRPSWWQDYRLTAPRVLASAKPMAMLRQKRPTQLDLLDIAARQAIEAPQPGEVAVSTELLWLPLVGRRSTSWVVLLDPFTARIRGYAAIDGFD